MLKLTKFLAGIVAAGSVAYADDLPKLGKSSIKQVQAVPETPAAKVQAPVVPMPAEPAAVPPSTMTIVDSATADDSSKRFWFNAEYGIYRTDRSPFPNSLLVASPSPGLPFVANPDTRSLFGPDNVGLGNASAMLLTAGTWLTDERVIGVEASLLLLKQQSFNRSFSTTTVSGLNLAIPFLSDVTGGTPAIIALNGPQIGSAGIFDINLQSRFWGYDAKLVFSLDRDETSALELVTGYRYLSLDEKLVITNTGDNGPTKNIWVDSFDARNDFYGAQMGLRKKMTRGALAFDIAGLLSMGYSHQQLDAQGMRSTSGVPDRGFGLFTRANNTGTTAKDSFSVIPEVNAKIAYNITSNIALSIGYQGIYWTNVWRPGTQIDNHMNTGSSGSFGTGQIPVGAPNPQRVSTDYWAQGLLFGISLKY